MAQHVYLPSNRSPRPGTQKFQAAQPLATHYGPVSCKDYECEQYLGGFKLILSVESQADHIEYIRSLKNKRIVVDPRLNISHLYTFTEEQNDPLLITFTFPPGQPCFNASKHIWHVRPPIFLHDRNEMRRTLRFTDFADLMNEESYKVTHGREKG